MVGAKFHEPVIIGNGSAGRGPARLGDLCTDRRYVEDGHVLKKSEQPIDEMLESVVNGEIIPRLMLLHQKGATANGHRASQVTGDQLAAHSDQFARLVIDVEIDLLTAYVNALLGKGVGKEALLINLFAPAARRLGELWEADEIDFVDVTIGTSRLQRLLHDISWGPKRDATRPARRILLLPTPTEQHSFGLVMVGDFFRRDGWEVTVNPLMSLEEMSAVLNEQWFSIIGFTLSTERLLGKLGSAIKTARAASMNPKVKILAGGRVFAENRSAGRNVDADVTVADAREAVSLTQNVH